MNARAAFESGLRRLLFAVVIMKYAQVLTEISVPFLRVAGRPFRSLVIVDRAHNCAMTCHSRHFQDHTDK